ncbi:MAG: tetratricopeptide repeat protein [Planctomycetes bacterium]|nr:tetratricopeptide repeat protein [Planctomycetota bacterium]
MSENRKSLFVCGALAAITLLVYWPVTGHRFVNWDDDRYVYDNAHVSTGLTWDNFVWSWGIHGPGQWHPMAWWSHQLDSSLFGADQHAAPWHHSTSLILHILATVALFAALKRLTGAIWPSALVAALFALHPLGVQSVAWIAERRNVLSGLFGALTIWFYAGYARRSTLIQYVLVIVCFILGLMSKPSLVTLPCVLLLLDFWPLRRIDRLASRTRAVGGEPAPPRSIGWLLVEKGPLFALAGLSVMLSYLCHQKAVMSLAQFPASSRLSVGALSYVVYLGHLVWPWNLSPEYPLPKAFVTWEVAAALAAVLAITAVAVWQSFRRPYLLVGWLWYVGTLFPLVGPLKFGVPAWLWDHYTYLPLVGIYIAAAWSLKDLAGTSRQARAIVVSVAVVMVALCTVATRRQVGFWRDSLTLFDRAIAVDSAVPEIHNNLGLVLQEEQGQFDKAIEHYREALRLNPTNADAHYNWGNALRSNGRTDEAMRHYQEALRLKPDFAKAHNNWGSVLRNLRRYDEAVVQFQAAVQSDPELVEAQNNWGNALQSWGRAEEALPHYREAVRRQPNYWNAHNNWGNALQLLNRHAEAMAHYREAVRLNPRDEEAQYNWGSALQALGRWEDAAAHFREALRLKPDYAEALNNLGVVSAQQGKLTEAIAHFQRALQVKPDYRQARDNLAQVQALLEQHRQPTAPHPDKESPGPNDRR